MNRHSAQTKLISLFVLAFICLNAGGAVCVAYCRTSDGASPNSAVGKPVHHCEKAPIDLEGTGPAIAAARELRPCPMTVSFIAGPIEKHTLPVFKSTSAGTQSVPGPTFEISTWNRTPAERSYRGPPPLDRRVERIKQCVLLI